MWLSAARGALAPNSIALVCSHEPLLATGAYARKGGAQKRAKAGRHQAAETGVLRYQG